MIQALDWFQEKFMDAKANFEKLGAIAKSRPLLRFGAKDHYFRACLCAFAMDSIHAKVLVKQFVDEHPAFKDCREYHFLVELLEAFNEDSVEMFDASIEKYRMISSCHKWLLDVLEKIRETLPSVCGWSELEGDVTTSTSAVRNPVLATNRFLPATYLGKASMFLSSHKKGQSSSNESTNNVSVNFQNISSRCDDDEPKVNLGPTATSARFTGGDFKYDGELNPFNESYRDANEEELDLS